MVVRTFRVQQDVPWHCLQATCVQCGTDLVVVVGGGERFHVGAAALGLSVPSLSDPDRLTVSSSVLAVPGHKEDELARDMSRELSRALARSVVVTVGIHEDGLEPAGIEAYRLLFRRLVERIALAYGGPPGGFEPGRRA
jgi:uncharacterized SAM-binding protein YcdF (DUF218 family)